jgi:hypothetical protein
MRAFKVYLNGELLVKILDGETKVFEINKGVHEVWAKIDWCKTKPFKLEVKTGSMINLELGSNLKGPKMLYMSSYYTFFKPSQYLYLKNQVI